MLQASQQTKRVGFSCGAFWSKFRGDGRSIATLHTRVHYLLVIWYTRVRTYRDVYVRILEYVLHTMVHVYVHVYVRTYSRVTIAMIGGAVCAYTRYTCMYVRTYTCTYVRTRVRTMVRVRTRVLPSGWYD